jgi:predicted membrane chloride channel (bestrophin family)
MTHSYQRFWAGRCAWQRLMDTCRNSARRAVTWCAPRVGDADAVSEMRVRRGQDIAAHLLALVAATEARLRCSTKLTFHASLASLVPHTLLDRLAAAPHAPLACAHELGRLLHEAALEGTLSHDHAATLDAGVSDMLAAAGECDCIARTPTPFEFAAHTARFLTLFCFSLPLVLVPQMGWVAIPASTLVAYSLLAIDEMSAVIESPFTGYLPLRDMFAALRGDVLDFVGAFEGGGAAKSSRL